MAKTAKAAPGTHVVVANEVFDFGADGTRQVTEAEAELLRTQLGKRVTIEDTKPRKEKS